MSCKSIYIIGLLCLFFKIGLCHDPPETDIKVDMSIPFTFTSTFIPHSVIIPFEPLGGLILLKARVNDQEGNFILDTGANGLVLNNQYFDSNYLLANERGIGLSGSTGAVGVAKLDSMNLEELSFKKIKAQTLDLRHLENQKKTKILGLIGFEVLKDFEIMFNYRKRFLIFSELNQSGEILVPLPNSPTKIDSIAFTLGNHIPIIEVMVKNKPKRMGIDTGAEYNLINIKRSKNILPNFKILKTIEIAGAGEKPVQALAGKLFYMSVNEKFKCGGMSTVMINFNHLNEIYKTKLDGILGYEFLAPWLFSINYKKQQLYLHELTFKTP